MIELRDVTKAYRHTADDTPALVDVTLRIAQGESVAIMGPSGSGKTTLLHLMGCLTLPTRGEVWLSGRNIAELSHAERARLRSRAIGFIFQRYDLLPDLTVLENVMLPLIYGRQRGSHRKRVLEALEAVGMAEYAHRRPAQLSGGQQQRVAIARALVTEAPVILADEPTGALDSRTGQEVLDRLSALHARGRTLVIVTHNPDVAARCSRIIHLQDGRITRETGAA